MSQATRRFTLITAAGILLTSLTLSFLFTFILVKATYYDPRTVTKEDLQVEMEMVELWAAIQHLTVLNTQVDLVFARSPAIYNSSPADIGQLIDELELLQDSQRKGYEQMKSKIEAYESIIEEIDTWTVLQGRPVR